MDETGAYYTEWSESERYNIVKFKNKIKFKKKKNTNAVYYCIYMEFRKMVTMTLYARQPKRQMYRTVFWTLWEKARVGWFERIALKHVYYYMWNGFPVQVWCMRQGTQGWFTGMTLRDGMGRKVGRRFRVGKTCTPMADSCQCMAKTTTILKNN